MKKTTGSSNNPLLWLVNYVRQSKEEMEKVTWPSKQDVIRYSALTVVISVFIAAFFAGLDWLLQMGLEELIILAS